MTPGDTCPHCGRKITDEPKYPEKVFMIVRKMKSGHQGRISEGQERYFDALGPIFREKGAALKAFTVAQYAVYECVKIGLTDRTEPLTYKDMPLKGEDK